METETLHETGVSRRIETRDRRLEANLDFDLDDGSYVLRLRVDRERPELDEIVRGTLDAVVDHLVFEGF